MIKCTINNRNKNQQPIIYQLRNLICIIKLRRIRILTKRLLKNKLKRKIISMLQKLMKYSSKKRKFNQKNPNKKIKIRQLWLSTCMSIRMKKMDSRGNISMKNIRNRNKLKPIIIIQAIIKP
jgi:hypothetical protein